MYQLQIAEQYQRERRDQAEKWRLTHPKETHYQPIQAMRRNKRKRQR
jgi:hypothetical protein